MKKTGWFSLCMVLMLSVFALGNPLQIPPVPADVKWMVHFDMEKFRSSHLHDFLMEESFTRSFRKWNDRLNRELKMDVLRDMASITLYNAGLEEETIIGCFRGKFDKDYILGKIREATDLEEIVSGAHTLLHWDHREYAVFTDRDLVLYSNDRWAIENALKSISGRQENLMEGTDISHSVPKDAVMFAYIENPQMLLGIPAKSRFLDKIVTVLYHVSEQGDMVKSFLRMEAGSKEDAENLRDIFKGLMAVTRMQFSQEYDVMKFMENVRFKITGSTMEIEMEAPADEIFQLLRDKMKLVGLVPGGGI
jgi:hypothetical protein